MEFGEYCEIHERWYQEGTLCPICAEEAGVPGIDLPNYGAEALRENPVTATPVNRAEEVPAPATGANARQHGGNHYLRHEYRHWDWVHEMNLSYHVGCATKYIARWRNKDGVADLEKALHYAEKCEELDILPSIFPQSALNRFCAQLEKNDAAVIRALVTGNYTGAMLAIRWIIENDAA